MIPPGAARGRRRPGPRPFGFVAGQVRRAVVVLALVVVLPAVALAERLRSGSGRRVGRGAVLAVSRLLGVTYDIEGDAASWPESRVVVANHSSLLDVPALLVALPDARFLAAADLYRYPLLSSALRALDSVPVDRRHPREGRRQIAELARPGLEGTVVVFPEGGISSQGRARWRTGAFELAVGAGLAVCPVAISGTDSVMPPGGRLAVRRGRVRIRMLDAIVPAGEARGRRRLRDGAESAVLEALGGPEAGPAPAAAAGPGGGAR